MKEGVFNDWSLAGDWQRKLSMVLAVGYLIIWPIVFPPKSAARLFGGILLGIVGLAFSLACIWFGEELGEYYYRDGNPDSEITAPSPGKYVIIGGWILLLLPVWWILLVRLLVYLYA